MSFTGGARQTLDNPYRCEDSRIPFFEDWIFPSERSSTEEIPKEGHHTPNRFAGCSFSSERSPTEEILKEEERIQHSLYASRPRVRKFLRLADLFSPSKISWTEEIPKEGQNNQNRFEDWIFPSERSSTEEIPKEGQHTPNRFSDCSFCSERSTFKKFKKKLKLLTEGKHNQNRPLLLFFKSPWPEELLKRTEHVDIGTQSVLDYWIHMRNYIMDIGIQRRVLDYWIHRRNYIMDIGNQRRVLNHLLWLSRNYIMDIGTQRRLFLIFFGVPWTEEKLKNELHNQDVDIGTQNTKSCLPSLPSGEQCTEVLHEEKRHVEDEDFPIQNQHEDYGPSSAEVITQDNTKPEVKAELAETSGRGHNDITAFLCHLYNGVGEAAKNLMNISFIFTLYLMSITIVQPIHSLHIGMANQRIHFGEDVILECSFQQNDDNQSLLTQWKNGNSDILAHGRTSSNDEKYTVDLIQQGILYRYILTIRNLSVEDFDTYACQHNFNSTSFALYPSQTHFVYIPAEKEITASVTDDRGLKNVTFSISSVYPKPSCSCNSKTEMENLPTTDEAKLSTDSHLYRIKIALNFMMPVKRCADVIDLICEASGFPFNKTVRINGTGCQEDIENDDGSFNLNIFLVCIGVVIFFIGILRIIYGIKTSKRGRTANEGSSATDEHRQMLRIT